MEANSSPMAVSTWINERVVLLVLKVSRIVVGTYLAEQDLIKAGLKAGGKVEEEETGSN
uniref:Bm10692 n=1 Tax=Brugia malayi TaxID=6279 RepID=A0A0K0IP57_BRUMA|nr:Bm10692 [Brugia malayi]